MMVKRSALPHTSILCEVNTTFDQLWEGHRSALEFRVSLGLYPEDTSFCCIVRVSARPITVPSI